MCPVYGIRAVFVAAIGVYPGAPGIVGLLVILSQSKGSLHFPSARASAAIFAMYAGTHGLVGAGLVPALPLPNSTAIAVKVDIVE